MDNGLELERIFKRRSGYIFKWTNSYQSLKWAFSLKNGLEVERIFKRKSGYRPTAKCTTYYVWLRHGRGGE